MLWHLEALVQGNLAEPMRWVQMTRSSEVPCVTIFPEQIVGLVEMEETSPQSCYARTSALSDCGLCIENQLVLQAPTRCRFWPEAPDTSMQDVHEQVLTACQIAVRRSSQVLPMNMAFCELLSRGPQT